MNEKVLVVPRSAIESFLQQGFIEPSDTDLLGVIAERAVFLDRAVAEEDISHKQIIPYILVTHKGKFLLYRRTTKQGESRLHNKLSLGFGGHINDKDGNQDTDTNLILAAMIRELNEEIFLPSVRQVSVIGFINDDSNTVGKVHLGIAFVVEASNDRFVVNEPEMIEAQWYDSAAIDEKFPGLETWSQLLWTQLTKIRSQRARSGSQTAGEPSLAYAV